VATLTADLTGRLDGLRSDVGKLGREQFRATTLLEGQSATLDELAETWRQSLNQRERHAAELRQALAQVEGQARLRLVQELLPVADALDASVRAAHELGAALRARPPQRPGLLTRWSGALAWSGRVAAGTEWSAALDAWLQGLLLVERRLLAVLEREDVRPIPALGQAFDPERHLAVAVTADSRVADGTVVAEERRGYRLGARVLRHAEVVVARRRNDGPGGSGDDQHRRD
jgi:molecular chaperone GrpE